MNKKRWGTQNECSSMNRDIMREGLRWKVLHKDRDKMNGRQIRDIVRYRYEDSGGGSMRQKYWQQR